MTAPPNISPEMMEQLKLFPNSVLLLVSAWVIADAVYRGKPGLRAFSWGFGVYCLALVFFPLYLITRWQEQTALKKRAGGDFAATFSSAQPIASAPCRYCGGALKGDPPYCPHCGAQLKSSSDIHPKP